MMTVVLEDKTIIQDPNSSFKQGCSSEPYLSLEDGADKIEIIAKS